MAIDNPQIRKFCNEVVRPLSDRLVGLDATIDIETVVWVETINLALSGYGNEEVIIDGSLTDGRTPITKKDVVDFIGILGILSTTFNAGDNQAIISKPHVNVVMP